MRAANLRVAYCQSVEGKDYSRQKAWDRELQAFWDAQRQGVEPAGTKMPLIRQAMEISERTGKPYKAGEPTASLVEN